MSHPKFNINIEYLREISLRKDISPSEIKEELFEFLELKDSGFGLEESLKEEFQIVDNNGEPIDFSKGSRNIFKLGIFNHMTRNQRNRKYYRWKKRYPKASRIIAEGDSWYCYPDPRNKVKDIICHLQKDFLVYTFAYGGDWLAQMSSARVWDKTIEKLENERADCLLLSGGGNDILGTIKKKYRGKLQDRPRMEEFLHEYTPGRYNSAKTIVRPLFRKAIKDLKLHYQRLLVDMKNLYPNVPVVLHSYDYPFPVYNARDYKKCGTWVGKPMFNKKITSAELRRSISIHLMDQFYEMLIELQNEFPNLHVIDLRTITSDQDHWYDEIHLKTRYMKKAAKMFKVKMLELGMVGIK